MNNSAVLLEIEKTDMCVCVFFVRYLDWPIVKHYALDGSQAWLHLVLIENSRHKEANTGE